MTVELVLFIVVAAVAIFSAALMLVSRNAVHSALFLIVNLLCVAFFYLMLNAPFLAMVQITVYAGAIMVLFMFVIMLLGSERLGGGVARFSWIATGAMGLVSIFLVVAFLVIANGQIGTLQPVAPQPQIRLVHAVQGAPAVDIYLNDQQVASDLEFGAATDLVEARTGDFNLLAFAACLEEDRSLCTDPLTSGATPVLALPLSLAANQVTTYVVGGTPETLQLIAVNTDVTPVADENSARVTVVHALPSFGPANFIEVAETGEENNKILAAQLAFGQVSTPIILPRDTYRFEFESGGNRLAVLSDYRVRAKSQEIFILASEEALNADGSPFVRPTALHLPPAAVRSEFGSPQLLGTELLTTYLLPFQLVALLLLGAMVGAIMLTREEVIKRERKRVAVSPIIKKINRAIPINVPAVNAQSQNVLPGSTGSAASAETSAD